MVQGAILSKVLRGKKKIGKYSTTNYKVVNCPTTEVVGDIKRFDERKTGFSKAFRGEYGPNIVGFDKKAVPALDKAILSYFFKLGMMPEMMPKGGGKPDGKELSGSEPSMTGMMATHSKRKAQEIHSDVSVVSRHVKSYGTFLGADLVGICEIPEYAYYSHDKFGNPVEMKYKYAICIAVDQDYDTLDASDGKDWISGAQSFMSYSRAAFIAEAMTKYIQMKGFEAKENHMMDYQVIVPPLLELAGIGEMGRHGIIINPSLGSRFKASVVLTNMPMAVDKPIKFGVQEFCKVCKKCAKECPSQSISLSDEKIEHNGYKKYDFNYDNCTKFRLANPHGSSCGKCLKVCPFNKSEGWLHDLARWTIRNLPFLNRLIVWGDDLMGYGRANTDRKWWFDFDKESLKKEQQNMLMAMNKPETFEEDK